MCRVRPQINSEYSIDGHYFLSNSAILFLSLKKQNISIILSNRVRRSQLFHIKMERTVQYTRLNLFRLQLAIEVLREANIKKY